MSCSDQYKELNERVLNGDSDAMQGALKMYADRQGLTIQELLFVTGIVAFKSGDKEWAKTIFEVVSQDQTTLVGIISKQMLRFKLADLKGWA